MRSHTTSLVQIQGHSKHSINITPNPLSQWLNYQSFLGFLVLLPLFFLAPHPLPLPHMQVAARVWKFCEMLVKPGAPPKKAWGSAQHYWTLSMIEEQTPRGAPTHTELLDPLMGSFTEGTHQWG